MNDCIEEIIIDEIMVRNKVKELGERITKDYEGKDLFLIGILKGSIMFMSDLMKEIKIPIGMDFMAVSSYGYSSESSGVVRILKDLDFQIEGKDIIIVEDIVDSGTTLKYLVEYLKNRRPATIEIAAFLSKPERHKVEIDAKYIGFEVPDKFLVGYGLDYAEKYRNFPYVGVLKESVYKK
ncbi:hypoxanthine phosphoribosyltransferase [Clostridium cellulovorans]|uniref:Hypoxanthine phosphoribosyltransferase n=1 Tax=Clostridium cellulovorans (strain ATCC 35296 / DSM 3052 / OCM 3 / 743B) TaxID=573061 RepID=D9SXF3_CLOC7|nr:hypoxanthine phosphoribosyltransferase [Clostridium cellulovorans]ADL53456.1 hypoxanthine phosphoribosyltransferase [Clostridium cellulovorans 743B]